MVNKMDFKKANCLKRIVQDGTSDSAAPGKHDSVGIVGFLPLSVLLHSRWDLPLHFDEIIHRVKGQFNVVPLQTHQVVMLGKKTQKKEKKSIYTL